MSQFCARDKFLHIITYEQIYVLFDTELIYSSLSQAVVPTLIASTIVGKYDAWKTPQRPRKFSFDDDIVIPEEFDSRQRWPNCPTIRNIRNQGKCGCCWVSFSGSYQQVRLQNNKSLKHIHTILNCEYLSVTDFLIVTDNRYFNFCLLF